MFTTTRPSRTSWSMRELEGTGEREEMFQPRSDVYTGSGVDDVAFMMEDGEVVAAV